MRSRLVILGLMMLGLLRMPLFAQDPPKQPGVVSHIRVLSDKVPDVSSMAAWRKSFIKEGMTDEQKALAAFRTVYMFQHQDNPPKEFLQNEDVVQDPIKVFNVYGYAFCSVASCGVEALSRDQGLEARGRILNGHSVPEVFYDGGWRLMDASLITLFPKADGKPAGVDEIMAGLKDWYEKNPGYKGNQDKLAAFMRQGGWRKGPEILSRTKSYDDNGWLPAATHGWYSTMIEYDGSHNGIYEYGYSQGYQVNIQLRPGERLVRNWSNQGMHVNMKDGGPPGCLTQKVGAESLRYTPADGDIAPGRVGNGTHVYQVPLADGRFRSGALLVENLASQSEDRQGPALHVKDGTTPGVYILRMPSSYVYLTGKLKWIAAMKSGGAITVSYSDNNGLDWQELARVSQPGPQTIDLSARVLRRYDYRLKFELQGAGTGLEALEVSHDVQHSQRVLPALAQGKNSVSFSAGPAEGTITIEGATDKRQRSRQVLYSDFHPQTKGIGEPNLLINGGQGEIAFPISTPGDMTRLRFGCHYRARDAKDGWDYEVSFDGGKSFQKVDRAPGPTAGNSKYTVFEKIPAGTRQAVVRFSGTSRNTTMIFDFRIDADYLEPQGGFAPVKVTYDWLEAGQPKQQVLVAKKPEELFHIECAAKPEMKSITLELAP